MKRREPKQVVQDSVIETTCDSCGKRADGDPDGWVELRTGHSDWGNDSIEASRGYDACSGACLLALLRAAVVDYGPLTEGDAPTFYAYISGELTYSSAGDLASAPAARLSEEAVVAAAARSVYPNAERDGQVQAALEDAAMWAAAFRGALS